MQHDYARVLLLSLLLSLSFPALATIKAGYVSVERVLKESLVSQRAQRAIDAEFGKRDQERSALVGQLAQMKSDLERDLITLSDRDRAARERALSNLNAELERKQRQFAEDLSQRRGEELAAVMRYLRAAVEQIAKAEGYDIVFQEAVWVDARIDITDEVIKTMNEVLQREPGAK
ncbi:MAG: OmpH family outer membrane protein [Pseudomonadota bacterium]